MNFKYAFIALGVLFLCAVVIAQNLKKGSKDVFMAGYESVAMEEGLKMMEGDKDFVLIDARRPDEYAGGHIPGALLLTNETMTEEKAEKIIPSKDTKIYVYCRSGRRSKLASQKLSEYGYTSIVEIGGIIDYKGQIEK